MVVMNANAAIVEERTEAPAIEIRDLSVSFGAARVIKHVSLSAARGECLGLIGESGSGKSTILKALTGMVEATGTVNILSRPASERRRDKILARGVQMVFQDPYAALHPRHSIERILEEPLAIQGIGEREQKIRASLA